MHALKSKYDSSNFTPFSTNSAHDALVTRNLGLKADQTMQANLHNPVAHDLCGQPKTQYLTSSEKPKYDYAGHVEWSRSVPSDNPPSLQAAMATELWMYVQRSPSRAISCNHRSDAFRVGPWLRNEPVTLEVHVREDGVEGLQIEAAHERSDYQIHHGVTEIVPETAASALAEGNPILLQGRGAGLALVEPALGDERSSVWEDGLVIVHEHGRGAQRCAGGNDERSILQRLVRDALRARGDAVVQTQALVNDCGQIRQGLKFRERWKEFKVWHHGH